MGKEDEAWRKNADTYKISNEKLRVAAGVEESKRPHPGEVLHQWRRLPYSYAKMAIAGFLIPGVVGYFTLYLLNKPDADDRDIAKVATGAADLQNTPPRN